MTSKQPEYRTLRLRSFEFQLYIFVDKGKHEDYFLLLFLFSIVHVFALFNYK